MKTKGLTEQCYEDMLDYTIELFESKGLGYEYYGYHNINHELEVTYVSLLAARQQNVVFDEYALKHLYVAALFHDFDPLKNVDKPHEESVLSFISVDKKLQDMIKMADIDFEIVKVLIMRTTYPWSGDLKKNAETMISDFFDNSPTAKNDFAFRDHVMEMGRYLSVVDRISGYVLGDFTKAIKMAKMNAHALGWAPSVIFRRGVGYFEELLNNESAMIESILGVLPKDMRMNFFDTVLSFMKIRQQEISIQADHMYENLTLVPTIECMVTRNNSEFIKNLKELFLELPTPLQFESEKFEESVMNPNVLLNTLRINGRGGKIVGYAKGGPLEAYKLREEITDDNFGKYNTIFLEPIALRIGYWGMKGGSSMRHMFVLQAHSMKYEYLTSFALREVIESRIGKERAEFVKQFDPERWDYYRIRI